MRGKVENICQGIGHHRITPAYAGKSVEFVVWVIRLRDHPRLCGEK